jgi:hypothetical protein
MPADIRFPLERANGVQIVKTAAALARAAPPTTLAGAQERPRARPPRSSRSTDVAADARLRVRRLAVGHRAGRFALPRLRFLARATAASLAALQRGDVVLTRDLQLADALLSLLAARAWSTSRTRSRRCCIASARRSTAPRSPPARPRRGGLERRERARVAARRRHRDHDRGHPQQLRGRVRTDAHGRAVIPNGCDVPDARAFPGPAAGVARARPVRRPALPLEGRRRARRGVRFVPDARLGDPRRTRGRAGLRTRARAGPGARAWTAAVELKGTLPQVQVAPGARARRGGGGAVPEDRHDGAPHLSDQGLRGDGRGPADRRERPALEPRVPAPRRQRAARGAGRSAALAEALRRLLLEKPLAETLARNAYAEAPRFSWDARARKLGELFQELA